MKIRGILLGFGKNEKGYKWIDIEGLRLDLGKDGVDYDLERMKGREVEATVSVQWVRTQGGEAFPRRRVLSLRVVD